MACKCTQKKKEPAGGAGNFKYTFECVKDDIKTCQHIVTAANDKEAQQLAVLECEDEC